MELGNYNEKTTETELNKLHPDLTVGPMVSGMLETDITPGRGREIYGLLSQAKPAEAGSLRCPFGCAHPLRATQLSPTGQSEGSRAEDPGCPWSWCPSPSRQVGELGWKLWWCLASSPTEIITSEGVEMNLCTTSRRAQQLQVTGPRVMRRWEERGWGDSRKAAQRSQGPTALGSTAADSSGSQVWGPACLP